MRRVGLIVNPVAGLGGSVALKGSDGPEIQARARALGAVPHASDRAAAALRTLVRVSAAAGDGPGDLRAPPALPGGATLVVAPGPMGEEAAASAGVEALVVGDTPAGRATTAADTRAAVAAMVEAGVELVLFAGGDGTARDVHDALQDLVRRTGESSPSSAGRAAVVGIPAGCKIHSAVYAANPASAGKLARRYLEGTVTAVADLEVMDIDEDAFRAGEVKAQLHGFLPVPDDRRLTQGAKVGGRVLSDAAAAAAIAERVVEGMEPGRLYIIGPGTTTRVIKRRLGLDGTLLGIDAFSDRRPVAADATESELLRLLGSAAAATIVVTVIGGQGAILGRGNQQLSPAVVRWVGLDNIVVVATAAKLATLRPSRLIVDTGDLDLDAELSGHRRVITGYHEEAVLRVD